MTLPILPKDPRDTSDQKTHPKYSFVDKIGEQEIKFSIGLRTSWADMAEKEVTEFVIAFEHTDNPLHLSVLGIEKYFTICWIKKNAIGLWGFSGNSSYDPASPELMHYYFSSVLALKGIQDRDIMVLCHVPQDRKYILANFPVEDIEDERKFLGFAGDFTNIHPTVLTNAINEFMLNLED